MTTLLASMAVFGLAVFAMALGVVVQGRQLTGSCGATGESCHCSPLAARHCRLRQEREATRSDC